MDSVDFADNVDFEDNKGDEEEENSDSGQANPIFLTEEDEEALKRRQPTMEIASMIAKINSDNIFEVLEGTRSLRKVLCTGDGSIVAIIDQVLETGIGPRLVSLLQRDELQELQFELAWVLTNIASGTNDHTKAVVDLGAVPELLRLLTSTHADTVEQCVWALSNIACDSTELRDQLIEGGFPTKLKLIGKMLESQNKWKSVKTIVWALQNLHKGNPKPAFHWVEHNVGLFIKMLYVEDDEIVENSLRTFSYITDQRIQHTISAGVMPRVVQLMCHPNQEVVNAAVRVIGDISVGDDESTQMVVTFNAIPVLCRLAGRSHRKLVKEVCWCLSNVCAGTPEQIWAVINCGGIQVGKTVITEHPIDVAKEAVWMLSNMSAVIDINIAMRLVAEDVHLTLLAQAQGNLIEVALTGINNIVDAYNQNGIDVNGLRASIFDHPACNEVISLQGENHAHRVQRVIDQFLKFLGVEAAEE